MYDSPLHISPSVYVGFSLERKLLLCFCKFLYEYVKIEIFTKIILGNPNALRKKEALRN
jgi:hypothetical protein